MGNAFVISGGGSLGAMNVNVWDVVDDLRSLIDAGRVIEPARLADADIELMELLS